VKFDVKFVPRSFIPRLEVLGPGAVYLDETGIVVEGDFPRFYVPFMKRVLRQIIGATSLRTIPYSRITQYKPPRFMSGGLHNIRYTLPSGAQQNFFFTMQYHRRANDEEFMTRFNEFRAAAQTYLKA
jgi:hypothetical protein